MGLRSHNRPSSGLMAFRSRQQLGSSVMVWSLISLLLLSISSSVGVAQAQVSIVVSGMDNNTETDSSAISTSISTASPSLALEESATTSTASTACLHDRKTPYDETRHQRVYKIGVLAIRGFDAAYEEFNRTFVDYLTATAGQRFDPPLAFELKPLNFRSLFTDTAAAMVDFIYVNPSAFSCIESEFTAHSLVSQVSRRKISGNVYHLKKFGGVIFRRHDNDAIQSLQDIEGKIVAAASISGLGSGQMQFLAMQQAGMSYINDPKQLVFTSNQGKVVNGVLNGEFDVGFVRTDQIERTKDSNGTLVDPNLFEVLDVQPNLTIDDEPFPFESSTPLYPEWNIAALAHVPVDVQQAVMEAMLAVVDHAQAATDMAQCMDQFNSTDICDWDSLPKARCDTTRQVAEIALDASNKGKYSSWTTTLSYMQLRSMQEVTGFIQMDPQDNIWKCTRSTTLYDAITCPDGYYKETQEEVETACDDKGLVCKEGYQCICSPCVEIVECVDAVSIGSKCVPYDVFLPSVLVPIFFLLGVAVHFYVEYRRKQADSVWLVQAEELHFDEPATVLGQGTFGFVLLAEYRGTKVAVKKVLPPPKQSRGRKGCLRWLTGHNDENPPSWASSTENGDVESAAPRKDPGLTSMGLREITNSMDSSIKQCNNLGLRSMASRLASLTNSTLNTGGTTKRQTFKQLQADFIKEMRHLAKLRHPCITTVMGAVVSVDSEPMLVMEHMNRGSLYDVLRDDSIELDLDDHIMPILQDIAQGVRFLHAATPIVIHGDLKAKNVLIDMNFRAKVTDFGLSAKKKNSASGTPYWMSPELLRGESSNNEKSDIYALGILIYEVFSGQDPYEGENYHEVLKQICDIRINKRPEIPDNCSIKIGEVIKDCVSPVPHFRPTAEQVDLALRVEGSVKARVCKLEKLNNDLADANKRIEEASKMQLEHFACMSHEIRTPLNCIVGLSSLMEGADLNPSQQEQVGMISASSRLLQSIVDDVLDYSKLQSGNAEVDIKRSDIQQVVADLVKSMRASVIATKRNLSFSTKFGPRVTQYVETDGRRLLQILFNLVSNAVKFSKNNGVVEVQINICERVEPLGAPRKSQNDDEEEAQERKPLVSFGFSVLRFTVKDYGKGIEKKNFDRIFQPFTQTNSGVSNIDGGTGLGLAITEKLIRALGGDIRVDSCVQQWTEFTVDLPFECAPTSGHQMGDKFNKAEIFTVSSNKYVSETFDFFHVARTELLDLSELESALKSKPREKDIATLCFLRSDLFDAEATKRLSLKHRVKFIAIGPASGLPENMLHYPSLGETIPAVFLEELATVVEEQLELTSSKAGLDFGSIHKEHVAPVCDLTKLRVLCAEDNLVNQKILIRMLKRLGVPTIEMMENGKLAVEKEAEMAFDIILMDMQMPVLDGIDATKQIVAREGGHKIPLIIFVTAHVSGSFEDKCLACGATAYLPKPYTLPVLKETLLRVAGQLSLADRPVGGGDLI